MRRWSAERTRGASSRATGAQARRVVRCPAAAPDDPDIQYPSYPTRPTRPSLPAAACHTCSTALRIRVCYVTDNTIKNERGTNYRRARECTRSRGVQVPAYPVSGRPSIRSGCHLGSGRLCTPRAPSIATAKHHPKYGSRGDHPHPSPRAQRALARRPQMAHSLARAPARTRSTHSLPRRPHAPNFALAIIQSLAHSLPRRTRAEPTRCRSSRTTMARR